MVFVKLFVSYFQLFHVMNLALVSFILVVEGKNACMTLLNFYSQGLYHEGKSKLITILPLIDCLWIFVKGM